MRCREHGRRFTLYPPGHVPYGRRAVAPVAVDGSLVRSEDGELDFSGTAFEAAIDAAEAQPWARSDPTGRYCGGGTDRWWSTQGRHLKRLTRWVGVAPDLSRQLRELIAEVLLVALLLLEEQMQRVLACPGYRTRGTAVVAVLREAKQVPDVADRLVAAGYIAGLWGCPHRWEADRGQLRPLLYRHLGTRSPPAS